MRRPRGKTRPAERGDFTCPEHGLNVVHRTRWTQDERTGERRASGEYMGCPKYHECGWYVSWDLRVPDRREEDAA